MSLDSMHRASSNRSDGVMTAITKHTCRKLNMKVIALTGLAGSGKDTVADIIQQLIPNNVARYSFANPVKEAAAVITGLDLSYFSSDNPDREVVHPNWNMTPRKILQLLGTDCCRDLIHKDIWIKRAQVEYHLALHKYPRSKMFIITDCRFNNEAEWIKSIEGEIWHVSRPQELKGDRAIESDHITEQGIDEKYYDTIIQNDQGIEELELNIVEALAVKIK